MKKNIWYSFLVLSILVISLSVGIYLGFKYTKNNNDLVDYNKNMADQISEENEDTTTSVSTKTYDIEVIYKDEYTRCGHIIENKNIAYGSNIDKVKEEENQKQKDMGNIYEIVDESEDRIVYSRKIEQNCPNHFLVKLEDKEVVIYNIVDETATMLYKKLEVDTQTLNPEMLEELNEGIKADSKEDLNLIIEDLES